MPVLSKEFLDIQTTIECRLTLKRVRDMTRTYSQCKHTYRKDYKRLLIAKSLVSFIFKKNWLDEQTNLFPAWVYVCQHLEWLQGPLNYLIDISILLFNFWNFFNLPAFIRTPPNLINFHHLNLDSYHIFLLWVLTWHSIVNLNFKSNE